MRQATIKITPIGHVEIDTTLNNILLVRGGWTIDGTPVNVTNKKVYRNKRNETEAASNRGVYLKEVKPGYFEIDDKDE